MTAAPDVAGDRFDTVCVVGLGNHARTKLIPALAANGQQLAGVVTRRDADGIDAAAVFGDLETALARLPPRTLFVIATPPALHFVQAMAVLRAGRDVLLEKPAFTSRREAVEATAAAARSGSALVEGFMHRHTNLYHHLLEAWRNPAAIKSLEIQFLIPEMPTIGTFRQGSDIASSSLYDMGCYPLSLLSDLGLPLDGLTVTEVGHPGNPGREAVSLAGRLAGVEVSIRVGVGATYLNAVCLHTADERSAAFTPFFFGRPGERRILSATPSSSSERIVREGSAFEAMFAVPRSAWLADQPERARRIVAVASVLEYLGRELGTLRRHSGSPARGVVGPPDQGSD